VQKTHKLTECACLPAGRHTAKFMAGGGFGFLLVTFQYLVGWGNLIWLSV
jgi:hypothetical protein